MRSFFLLLLLSLMTGRGASTEEKGCLGGWVDFTCKCPDRQKDYRVFRVMNGAHEFFRSSTANTWGKKDRVSVYHDKKERHLRVFIKQLQTQDATEWKCAFGVSQPSSVNFKLSLDSDSVSCQSPFSQTAYKKMKTTIRCEYPDHEYDSEDLFVCKEPKELKEFGPMCTDLLGRRFTHTKTDQGVNVSISKVSSEDQGIYWCGLKSESFRAGVRKIELKVKDIRVFQRSPAVGQTFSYWCDYSKGASETTFICKGDDPSVCQTLISSHNKTNGRFSMKDDPQKRNITITVTDVRAEDNGTYWCGAESSDTHRDTIYHGLSVTVVSPPPPTTVSTTQSTPATPERPVGSELVIIAVIVSAIVLLLFLLLSVLICKRFSKQSRSGAAAAQHNKENYVYEEIPERIQNPDPVKTVYATVDFPRNPSASLLYSTIIFEQSSVKTSADGPTLKLSSLACEYSSIKQSPADTHANNPSIASEEPLYSTVNKK